MRGREYALQNVNHCPIWIALISSLFIKDRENIVDDQVKSSRPAIGSDLWKRSHPVAPANLLLILQQLPPYCAMGFTSIPPFGNRPQFWWYSRTAYRQKHPANILTSPKSTEMFLDFRSFFINLPRIIPPTGLPGRIVAIPLNERQNKTKWWWSNVRPTLSTEKWIT